MSFCLHLMLFFSLMSFILIVVVLYFMAFWIFHCRFNLILFVFFFSFFPSQLLTLNWLSLVCNYFYLEKFAYSTSWIILFFFVGFIILFLWMLSFFKIPLFFTVVLFAKYLSRYSLCCLRRCCIILSA